jgi:hypothetical protein
VSFRAGYLAAARAALSAAARFSGVTVLQSWAGTIDIESLPVIGVVIGSETIQPGSGGQFERSTLLQVILKRNGTTVVEDELDDDAAAIEAAVFPALHSRETQCFPADVAFSINGDGRERVGTVVVTFRITSWRPAP